MMEVAADLVRRDVSSTEFIPLLEAALNEIVAIGIGVFFVWSLQTLDDSAVVAVVNEIETLTTGLSRKIWQKINLVTRSEPGGA